VVTVGHDAPSVAERFALQTTLPAGGPVVKARARPAAPNRTFTALCNTPGFHRTLQQPRFHRTSEQPPVSPHFGTRPDGARPAGPSPHALRLAWFHRCSCRSLVSAHLPPVTES